MVDPAKDYYNERLAQAAWGMGSSIAFPGPGHPGLADNSHVHPSSVHGHGGHGASAYGSQSNYLHSAHSQVASVGGFDVAKSRVPNGGQNSGHHSFMYPSIEQYHQPLPAHTSVARSGSVPSPIAGPLPAHMRSNPYQASPYPSLNPSYNHFTQSYGYPSVHGPPIIQGSSEKSHSASSSHNGNNSYYPNPNHPKDFSRHRQSSGNDSSDTTINLSSHPAKPIHTSDNSQPPQGYNSISGFPYHQSPTYQNYYCNPASFLNFGNPYPNRPSPNEKSPSVGNNQQISHHLPQNENHKTSLQLDGVARSLPIHDSMQGTPSGDLSHHQSVTVTLPSPKTSYISQASVLQNSEPPQNTQSRPKTSSNQALFNDFYQPSTSQASVSTSQNFQSTSSEPVSFVNAPSPLPSGPKNMSLKRPASLKGSGSEFKQKYFKRDGSNINKDGSFDATDDPYAFDDDDTNASNQSSGSLDFSRKSCNSPSGPVYKFKNALLTRTSENGPQGSPSSSKSLNLDSSLETFSITCDKLIDDLNTKLISVSRRPSLEVWQATMAAKAAQKEKRKEKKVGKSDDSQNNSVLQNHGSSEGLSPFPSDLSQLEKPHSQPESKQDDVDMPSESKNPEFVNGEGDTFSSGHNKGPNSGLVDPNLEVVSKDVKAAGQSVSQDGPGSNKLEEGFKPAANTTPQQTKKGALWALPIVPKPPQKQADKRLVALPAKKLDTPRVASDASGVTGPTQGGSATDIWLQAFGVSKPKKNVEISQSLGKQAKSDTEIPVSSQRSDLKTILDIPPELRRRPKPNFGGLIYFSPDWEREVLRFHEKQRVPTLLAKNIIAKPKFLMNSQPLGTSSLSPPAEINRPATPPNRPAINLMSLSPNGSDDMPLQTFGLSSSEALPSSSKNVMETILENRKKLRNSITMGRMFRMPAIPEKKRYNSKGTSNQPADPSRKQDVSGLLPTPGMPLWVDSDNHQEEDPSLSLANPFGNFRRETILRYLGDVNPDLRTKILDWKPEIYETKTRRQSNQARCTLSLGDIFGDVGNTYSHENSSAVPNESINTARSSSDEELESPLSSPITSPLKSSKSSPVTVKKRAYKKRSTNQVVVKEENDSEDDKQHLKEIVQCEITPENFLVPKIEVGVQEPQVKKRGRKKLSETPPRLGRPPKNKQEGQILTEKQIKVEPSSDIVKPKRGRKPKNAAASLNSTLTVEAADKLSIDIHKEFSSGGSASGAFAAVALAIDTAKERALEKEKPAYKRLPKKVKIKMELEETDVDDYVPNEEEEKLQLELQNFAQELLDKNKSWDRRKVIQNLVIWEFIPVDPALLPPPLPIVDQAPLPPPIAVPLKRRPKKGRKNPSGLDFAKKKTSGKNSRGVSRATSPDTGGLGAEAYDISYTLDHLLAEINRWVIDKSAGETILHRAAKMGYPDAVAYALGMAKMNPKTKDNAGYPPIHKAAYRKHCEIVNMLLRFGADPNANVKGTRPLHEAIDGDSLACVHHLLSFGADPALYDYSGNTPIDLTEDSEEMHFYFTNVLADIDGRQGSRWNVSHCEDFHMPPDDLECEDYVTQEPTFEIVHDIPPPTYKLSDRPGRFMLSFDLKKFLKADALNKLPFPLDTVEISREEFLRHAVCCDLGCSPSQDIMTLDKINLIQLDANLKNYLGAAKST